MCGGSGSGTATRAGAIYAKQHMNVSGGNVNIKESTAEGDGGRSLSWSCNMGLGLRVWGLGLRWHTERAVLGGSLRQRQGQIAGGGGGGQIQH